MKKRKSPVESPVESPTETPSEAPVEKPDEPYRALDAEQRQDILARFTPEEQAKIERRRRVLSSLAYFIGKDFHIPVELNEPGAGWHWDFKDNIIRVDPKDLLEKSMDYLRFVISHEGGHRRISRVDFISTEEWREPGFAFMMNAVEDPRDNNFVAESYPRFREQMTLAYREDLDIEGKMKEKAEKRLGYQPRFMRAGFEYIKQWFRETRGEETELSEDLPEDVREVVASTLESARDSWWRYPSREEADESEETIRAYAKLSYEINRDEVWPAFKKLVEADMEDQKTQELLDDMRREQGEGEGGAHGLPRELEDTLTPEEQKELEDAIEKAIEEAKNTQESGEGAEGEEGEGEENPETGEGGGAGKDGKEDEAESGKGEGGDSDEEAGDAGEEGGEDVGGGAEGKPKEGEVMEGKGRRGKAIDLGSLSEGLRKKLKDYIDSLPEDKKKALKEKARASFKEFEDDVNEELRGKLVEAPEKKAEDGESEEDGEDDQRDDDEHSHTPKTWTEREREREEEMREQRKRMEVLFESDEKNAYERTLDKVSGLVDALTAELRDVFARRKMEKYASGYRSGRKWNIRRRIQEKIANIPLWKSEARERRSGESEETDYAITLLVDLSASMRWNGKIEEAFKSTVVLAETLENLGIAFEVVGFQDTLLEFKSFEDRLDESTRNRMSGMVGEVYGNNEGGHNNPSDNDDGACLREASAHLSEQGAENKFLIVISDGIPETRHKSSEQLDRELREVIAEISGETDQNLIGLGLNSEAVAKYYENNISGISTEDMVETLGSLLEWVIENS